MWEIIRENTIVWWLLIGMLGWLIGWVSDSFFYRKERVHPMWFLIGPFIFFIAVKSLAWGIVYKVGEIRKARRNKNRKHQNVE